jgi:hypothetical protein
MRRSHVSWPASTFDEASPFVTNVNVIPKIPRDWAISGRGFNGSDQGDVYSRDLDTESGRKRASRGDSWYR